jgi:hypothetical protein
MYSNEIMGITMFHTFVEATSRLNSYIELPCYSKIINCAMCGGANSNKCKICMDGFALVNVTDS